MGLVAMQHDGITELMYVSDRQSVIDYWTGIGWELADGETAPGPPGGEPVTHDQLAAFLRSYAAGLPEAHDSFSSKPNGSLTVAASGHTWHPTGANPLVLAGGVLTLPAGAPALAAGYAFLSLGASLRRVGARFRFAPGANGTGSVTVGAFASDVTLPSASPAHLSITPTVARFSVWSVGGVETLLTPVGHTAGLVPFETPLLADGSTEYLVDVRIDAASATAWVLLPDGTSLTYRHPGIAATSLHPFWEVFTQDTTDAKGQFTQVWTDSRPPSALVPRIDLDLAFPAAVEQLRNGAGPTTSRPPSARNPGMLWADTTSGLPTYSDGTHWRSTAGAIVGNLLLPNQANADTDATNWVAQTNCTVERQTTIVPTGKTSCVKLVSLGVGIVQAYTADLATVYQTGLTPGAGYTVTMSARAGLAGRTVTPTVSWFTSAGAFISTSTGSPVSIPNTAFAEAVFAVTAPALGTNAIVGLTISTPTAAAEAFYVGKVALIPGTATGYVEP